MKKLIQNTSIADQCWNWTASLNANGYGKYAVNKSWALAHRHSYETFMGPIPDGLEVCHRCDNRACINPFHLFLGTHSDNMLDMVNKGRSGRLAGEKHPQARLNANKVLEILTSARSAKQLASDYGVTKELIYQIRKGKAWKNVPRPA